MLDTILARRSIRGGFERTPLPGEVVDQIVACGLAAPSSKNAQPWRIHVVRSRSTLSEIADAVHSAQNGDSYVPINPSTGRPRPDWPSTVCESADVLRGVAAGIFVENCGRFSNGRHAVAEARTDVRESALIGYGFEMVGLGASIQSMWLGAQALGVAGVFMGDVLIAESEIRRRLNMQGDLVGVLALGYSIGEPTPKRLAADRVIDHGEARREDKAG